MIRGPSYDLRFYRSLSIGEIIKENDLWWNYNKEIFEKMSDCKYTKSLINTKVEMNYHIIRRRSKQLEFINL